MSNGSKLLESQISHGKHFPDYNTYPTCLTYYYNGGLCFRRQLSKTMYFGPLYEDCDLNEDKNKNLFSI